MLAHVSEPHAVPVANFAQPPAPSHRPFVPQLAANTLDSRKVCKDQGAEVSAQLRQAPPQASLQQTPSTQNPEAQSVACVHSPPFVRLPQL